MKNQALNNGSTAVKQDQPATAEQIKPANKYHITTRNHPIQGGIFMKGTRQKVYKSLITKPLMVLVVFIFTLLFLGCENTDPLSPANSNDNRLSVQKNITPLRMTGSQKSLNKLLSKSKFISAADGGQITLRYGNKTDTSETMFYGCSDEAPFNIYRINPKDVSNPEIIGQLAFRAKAIAVNPMDGLVFYVGMEKTGDIYPVAKWDPATNTNTVLPEGSSFSPAGKLAFSPFGELYGINEFRSNELYTINPETGEWTLFRTYDTYLLTDGDMAFSADGALYNTKSFFGFNSQLQIIDLNSNTVTSVGSTGLNLVSGLIVAGDGQFFASQYDGKIFSINRDTGEATLVGDTGINYLRDMASAGAEFSFVKVTLTIPLGALSNDAEISLSMSTTEIFGGAYVNFEPHGTVFNQPAILNLTAFGVDFTGVDTKAVDFYYDNTDTGQWEKMQRDDVRINLAKRKIRVINALLPHFSRYALARS